MERLTRVVESEIYNKLAEYEDTGLTPAEVWELKEKYEKDGIFWEDCLNDLLTSSEQATRIAILERALTLVCKQSQQKLIELQPDKYPTTSNAEKVKLTKTMSENYARFYMLKAEIDLATNK